MKYCKYCGRQLQEDEMCTCEDAVQKQKEAASEAAMTTTINPYAPTDSSKPASYEDDTTLPEAAVSSPEPSSQPVMAESLQIGEDNTKKQDSSGPDVSQSASNQGTANSETADPGPKVKKTVDLSIFKTALSNIIPYLKAFVKAPASAITVSAENTDLPLAGIIYAIYCISLILCETLGFSRFWKALSPITTLFSFGGSSLVKVSYPWLILCALLTGILLLAITNLVLIIIGICYHSKYNFKQILAGSCGIYIYPTICFLLATIVMFLSVPAACFLLSIGYVAYLIVSYFTIKTLFQKNENSPFLFVSIVLVTALCVLTTVTALKLSAAFSNKVIKANTDYYNENNIGNLFQYYN